MAQTQIQLPPANYRQAVRKIGWYLSPLLPALLASIGLIAVAERQNDTVLLSGVIAALVLPMSALAISLVLLPGVAREEQKGHIEAAQETVRQTWFQATLETEARSFVSVVPVPHRTSIEEIYIRFAPNGSEALTLVFWPYQLSEAVDIPTSKWVQFPGATYSWDTGTIDWGVTVIIAEQPPQQF